MKIKIQKTSSAIKGNLTLRTRLKKVKLQLEFDGLLREEANVCDVIATSLNEMLYYSSHFFSSPKRVLFTHERR